MALQAPIPYLQYLPQVDLGQKTARLAQTLQQNKLLQMKQQEAMQSQALQQRSLDEYRSDLAMTIEDPTQKNWVNLMAKYPEQSKVLGDASKIYGQDRIDSDFLQGAQISTALENGAIDVAKDKLGLILEAYKNSGKDAGLYKQVFDQLEAGNIKGAQATTNMALALIDPEKFKKVAEGRSAAAKAPVELEKLGAEAYIKKAEAMFAPDKFGAELGLTESQIEASKAARRRSSIEADQIAAGIIPADKRPDAEAKFRKEYSDQTKDYKAVKAAYGRIQTVAEPKTEDEEGPADLALIFNYMKMLDPGSVVREGEFATAQNATGVPDRIRNLWNNLQTGGRLNPGQRRAFKGQAEKLYKTAADQEKIVRKGIARIASGYGLDTNNIFYEATDTPPGQSNPVSDAAAQRTVMVDY